MVKEENYNLYKNLISTESVAEGHPDKLADQLADLILDAHLEQDENARIACNVFLTTKKSSKIKLIILGGEITSKAKINYKKLIFNYLKTIYLSFKEDEWKVLEYFRKQSPEINIQVQNKNLNFGDQSIVYGYANNETAEYLPLGYILSNKLLKRANYLRKNKTIKHIYPDMKSLITIDYNHNINKKNSIKRIVLCVQHDKNYNKEVFIYDLKTKVILPILKEYKIDYIEDIDIKINPYGEFSVGGVDADSGFTNKKIVIDTYGAFARHGGGGLCGKDYTKPDRIGCYFARYIAKNIVAALNIKKLELQLGFLFGYFKPINIWSQTYNQKLKLKNNKEIKVSNKLIHEIFKAFFKEWKLEDIIKKFNLKKIKYIKTSKYGHFLDQSLPWEQLDYKDKIKEFIYNEYK